MVKNGSMEIVLKNKTSVNLFYDEKLYLDILTAHERSRTGDTITIPIMFGSDGGMQVVEVQFLISELDEIRLTRNEVVRFGETVFGEKVVDE